jgi:hypothetical protein
MAAGRSYINIDPVAGDRPHLEHPHYLVRPTSPAHFFCTEKRIVSKDVIHVDGEDVVVREDTAKAFRGVNWALVSIAAFVIIAAFLFISFFVIGTSDGSVQSPAQNSNSK